MNTTIAFLEKTNGIIVTKIYSRIVFVLFLLFGFTSVLGQTITTEVISGSPFCAGDPVSVDYTITGTYIAGNIFTAQLSDAAGSFTSSTPTSIGTLTSELAGTIPATIPAGQAEGTAYRIRVVSSGPVVIGSDNGTDLIINATSAVGAVSTNQAICSGSSPVDMSIASATGIIQWQRADDLAFTTNVTNLGTNATTLTSAEVGALTVTRYFRAVVTSGVCAAVNSSIITVTVNATSAVGAVSTNQAICSGSSPADMTIASATGTIQWQRADDLAFTTNVTNLGTNAMTLTSAEVGALTATRYFRAVVTSGVCAPVYSSIITVTVDAPIAQTITGTNTVCIGSDTTLSSTTTGGTWSSATPGVATVVAGTGVVTGVSAGTSVITYSVTTAGGCVNTATETVTVNPLPPTPAAVAQVFCSTDNPTGADLVPSIYNSAITWYDDQNLTTPINSSTSLTSKNYYVTQTTNSCESAAKVVLVTILSFTNSGTHQIQFSGGTTGTATICDGYAVYLEDNNYPLSSNPNATLTYQWEISTNGTSIYNNIFGATNIDYTTPSLNYPTINSYRRITTSEFNGTICKNTSNPLTIIVGGAASGGTIKFEFPGSDVVCINGNVGKIIEDTPSTGGSGFLWVYSIDGGNNFNPTGVITMDYDPPAGITQTTIYKRITYHTSAGITCAVSSNIVTAVVPKAGTINNNNNEVVCEGDNPNVITFTGDEGIGYLTFQWELSSSASGTFSTILSATAASYDPPSGITQTTYYRRITTASIGGVACSPPETSPNAIVYVNTVNPGSITGTQDICYNETPNGIANVVSPGALGSKSYIWYKSTNASTIGTSIPNSNSINFPASAIQQLQQTTYYTRKTISNYNNVICSKESNTITVTVAQEIVPGTLSSDQILCSGETVQQLNVSGTSTYTYLNYEWQESINGAAYTPITGEITASYQPPMPSAGSTTNYKVRVYGTDTNGIACEKFTNEISVTLNSVTPGSIATSQTICSGDTPSTITNTLNGTATGSLSYMWETSTDNISYSPINQNTASYSPGPLTSSTYFRRVTLSTIGTKVCSEPSFPVFITVLDYPIIDNSLIITNDITDVSCKDGTDGSIIIPPSRITGGNISQKQIETITLSGAPIVGDVYSIILDGTVYSHTIILNGSSVVQTNTEITAILAGKINASSVDVSVTTAVITLTASVAGIPFVVLASTGSSTAGKMVTINTQPNIVANTYSWTKIGDASFSASTLSIQNITAGIYVLEVSNASCSTSSVQLTVNEPAEIVLSITNICNSSLTATAVGGSGNYTYTLFKPDGSTSVQISANSITYTGLTKGETYRVEVWDGVCNIIEKETVTLPLSIQINGSTILVEDVSCFGASDGSIQLNNGGVTITGGQAPYDYTWTSPSGVGIYITRDLTNLGPGSYTLVVTDQFGCSSDPFTVTVASKSVLAITNSAITNSILKCAGDTDASIAIQIAFDPSINVQIDWFKNTTSFDTNVKELYNLGAGVYKVIIKDTNPSSPCIIEQEFVITEPLLFGASIASFENPNCNIDTSGNLATGTVTIEFTGGTLPYSYSVDGGTSISANSTSVQITGLTDGSHTIELTDSNNCNVITLNQLVTIPSSITINYNSVTDIKPIQCNTGGSITVNVTGGIGPDYFYVWEGPSYKKTGLKLNSITDLYNLGTYYLYVYDENSCVSNTETFTILDNSNAFTVTGNVNQQTCATTNANASIELTLGNDIKIPYFITWEKWSLTDPTNITCTSNCYSWQQLPNTSGQLSVNNLLSGEYRATITDSNTSGCNKVVKKFTISTSSLEIFDENLTLPSCDNLESIYTFKVNHINPVKFYLDGNLLVLDGSILTYNSILDSYIITLTNTGTTKDYILKLVEQIPTGTGTSFTDGCEIFKNITLGGYKELVYEGNSSITYDICDILPSFEIESFNVNGGTPFVDASGNTYYIYEWYGPNNYHALGSIIPIEEGEYSLIIIDSQNCESSPIKFTFSSNYNSIIVNESVGDVSCDSNNDGYISIDIDGGKKPYNILWEQEIPSTETGGSSPTFEEIGKNLLRINNLEEGRYRLTVTSDIDCSVDIFQEIYIVSTENSISILEEPILDKELCLGNIGTLKIRVLDSKLGPISFLYDDKLITAEYLGDYYYLLIIENPVDGGILRIVNSQNCSVERILTSEMVSEIDLDFEFTSVEYVSSGYFEVNSSIEFSIEDIESYDSMNYEYVVWDFDDNTPFKVFYNNLERLDFNSDGENIETVFHTYTNHGIYEVALTFFNSSGCSISITKTIIIGEGATVMLPTVFSPNYDGINDFFGPSFNGIKSITMYIYDSWGNLVYEASNEDVETESNMGNLGWNGIEPVNSKPKNEAYRCYIIAKSIEGKMIEKTGKFLIVQ